MPELVTTLTNNPTLIAVADALRVACIIAASVLAGLIIGMYHKRPNMNKYQRARFCSLLIVSVVVGGSQYERIGDPVSYLLPAFVAFLATAIYGVWGVHSNREQLGNPRLPEQENL